jgi:esterase/lipase superfamily enzyme
MSLKSRLKHLEQNIKPKGKDPVQEWQDRVKRHEEMESLSPAIEEGNLQACIRYCQLCEESVVDRTFAYRDVFIKVAAMSGGYEPRYEEETGIDVWYHNLKATYKFLKEKGKVLDKKEPGLKKWKSRSF